MGYKAFISYKHGGLPVAERLAVALRAYAKPILRLGLKVFRDEDYLVPEGDLPRLIQRALDDSEYLVLLASPESAGSKWVKQEVEQWCADAERRERLIFVLIAGRFETDSEDRIDWASTDALPSELRPFLTKVPLYCDLRWVKEESDLDLANGDFKKVVNAICARLNRTTPNDMFGVEVLQTRRNVRIRNLGLLAVSIFALVATIAALLAERARSDEKAARLAAQQAEQIARRQSDLAKKAEQAAKESEKNERDALDKVKKALDDRTQALAREQVARKDEQVARKRAESRRLASEAERARVQMEPNNRDLDLAIRALETMPTLEAEQALRAVLGRPRAIAVLGRGEPLPDGVSLSPETTRSLTGRAQLPGADLRKSDDRVCDGFTLNGHLALGRDGHGGGQLFGEGGVPLRRLTELGPEVVGCAWSSDGKFLAVVEEQSVQLWNIDTGAGQKLEPHLEKAELRVAAFGPEYILALGDSLGRVHIWQSEVGFLPPIPTSKKPVNALAYNSDGSALAIGGDDGSVRVSRGGLADLRTFDAYQGSIVSVGFDQSNSYLVASSDDDGKTAIWPLSLSTELLAAVAATPVVHAELSPDNSTLLLASKSCAATWDLRTVKQSGPLCFNDREVVAIGFVDQVASAVFWGNELARWDISTRGKTVTFDRAAHPRAGTLDQHGRFAASTDDGFTRVWPAAGGEPVFERSATGSVLALSPDGRLLALAEEDRIVIFDRRAGEDTRQLKSATVRSPATSLAFSGDGESLAIGAKDGGVLVWDLHATSPSAMSGTHQALVTSVRFSADSTMVVSASEDATTRLWKVREHQASTVVQDNKPDDRRFRPDGSAKNSAARATEGTAEMLAAFRSDGRRILTVSRDGTVQVQDTLPSDLLLAARCVKRRGTSPLACGPVWSGLDARAAAIRPILSQGETAP